MKKKFGKKLVIKRETISNLNDDLLAKVHGGDPEALGTLTNKTICGTCATCGGSCLPTCNTLCGCQTRRPNICS